MLYELKQMLELAGYPGDQNTLHYASLGLALPLMSERRIGAAHPLGWHRARIVAAVTQDTLRICFDTYGRQCAHVLWSGASAQLEQALLSRGPDLAGPAELAPDGSIWVLDMGVKFDSLMPLLTRLRDDWLAPHGVLSYFRYKQGRRIAKRIRRSSHASFLRRSGAALPERAPFLLSKEGAGLRHGFTQSLDAAIELGKLLELQCQTPELTSQPLAGALQRVQAPVNLLQQRMYTAPDGTPGGFITWAWLERSTAARPFSALSLQPFEWNQGDLLCLMDAMATPACLEQLMHDLGGGLFPGQELSVCPRWESADPGVWRTWDPVQRGALAELVGTLDAPTDIAALLARKGTQ